MSLGFVVLCLQEFEYAQIKWTCVFINVQFIGGTLWTVVEWLKGNRGFGVSYYKEGSLLGKRPRSGVSTNCDDKTLIPGHALETS